MNYETYVSHIAAYDREFKAWEGRVKKILDKYRGENRKQDSPAKFNVLWSNVQTLKAATFGRMPRPDVSRRFKDNDPVGRVAALILERALEFEVEHYKDFGASMRQCVYDRFLGGRGTAWVRYQPTFAQEQAGEASGEPGTSATEDVEAQSAAAEKLDFEAAPVDYVHWKDFGHAVARTWEEVPLVWRKVYMRRPALVKAFGPEGEKIPLDTRPDDPKTLKSSQEASETGKTALVYELWDKDTGNVVFLSQSLGRILKEQEDPLQLEEFFPCPPPLVSTLTTDSLVPIPDFTLYQDQAAELDILSDRIDGLVKALQVKGVHDASVPELRRLFTEGVQGDLIPVKNWGAFTEKQGLKGAIDIVDLGPISMALREAYGAFEQIKSQIYELTGISDILRGQTSPSETATAQQIKNSYASMRLKTYQDEVERFAARLFQLKAQIICNHFDAATLRVVSAADQLAEADRQYIDPAITMLQDNVMRAFRIDVATDSMVYQDEQQEKQDRTEFLTAVSQFLEKAVEAGQQAPELTPLAIELLKFGVAGFRVGKTMEGTIDQVADALKQKAAQQAQNLAPNPETMKAQGQLQVAQVKAAADQQSDQARAQADMAIANAKASADIQMDRQRQMHEAQMAQMQARVEQSQQAMQQQHEAAMAQMQQSMHAHMQVLLQAMKGRTQVEVAEIAAQTTLDAAQISAASQGSE